MKRISLIALFFLTINSYVFTKPIESMDSILYVSKLDAVDELLFNKYVECELKLTPKQLEKLSTQQRVTILGRFFRWIGGFFEPIWGQYREPHYREDGPYMTFRYDEYVDL
jgi:hypothetical protein